MMDVSVAYQIESRLGEGPVWDYRSNELLWVDIEKHELNFYHPETKKYRLFRFDSRLGAAVPTDDNRLLLALQNGLAIFDPLSQKLNYFADPEKSLPDNRFNDGKCDPQGRFWIGSMDVNVRNRQGALYCVDNHINVTRKLEGLTISNGMAWSSDNQKMYFIDSATSKVFQFDFHAETGVITNQKTIIEVPQKHGVPDGMTIDKEGMLWIAHWGGANVSRWNPNNGKLLQKVDIPAPHVTSCCFGGKELDTLFITSARDGLTSDELRQYPLSGSLFSIQPNVLGMKSNRFKTNTAI
ncbi:MAG: SMP-30/gluconolactonase/LRE family protein [Marinilabiliaceae bacterium]|nr:SMP-30/gluconolactonase/LRE family protein [Marinilabiliaceae bacterium]